MGERTGVSGVAEGSVTSVQFATRGVRRKEGSLVVGVTGDQG